MRKEIWQLMVTGVLIVAIVGTLSHFVYDWTGQNRLIGFIFPVNESTWEHMKLIFFPMLLFSFYLVRQLNDDCPIVCFAALAGNLVGTWLIPTLFYTYRGILGFGISVADIMTFYVAVVLSFLLIGHMLIYGCRHFHAWGVSVLLLLNGVQFAAFLILTYRPLGIDLFQMPSVILTFPVQ